MRLILTEIRRSRPMGLRFCLVVALLLGGCAWFRGAINTSPAIRWWLFSNFGAQRLCPEMIKLGAGLKLSADEGNIGRFFPDRCEHAVDDARQIVTVQFHGSGYAWTPVAGRLGFEAHTAIEFRPDFYLADDAMYVWARTNRITLGPRFSLLSAENPVANWAAQGPAAYLANTFGAQLAAAKLSSGFTVVRTHEGDDFELGILSPPTRPRRPFRSSGERVVVANDRVRVRGQQVDFIGPIEVEDSDQVLSLRWRLRGPRAEIVVLQRAVADPWRKGLERGASLAPPPGPTVGGVFLSPGEGQHRFQLPPGQYFLVVDNSNRVGTVAPPWNPLASVGMMAVSLDYILELDGG